MTIPSCKQWETKPGQTTCRSELMPVPLPWCRPFQCYSLPCPCLVVKGLPRLARRTQSLAAVPSLMLSEQGQTLCPSRDPARPRADFHLPQQALRCPGPPAWPSQKVSGPHKASDLPQGWEDGGQDTHCEPHRASTEASHPPVPSGPRGPSPVWLKAARPSMQGR